MNPKPSGELGADSASPLHVLALEPYYGGSHQAFLDGWMSVSRHHWTLLTLPARHWKWRMRHAAITMARSVAETMSHGGHDWQVLVCSDMLALAEFRGLAPDSTARLPALAYFHENQLAYPDPHSSERDRHYGMTNLTTALAADQVWFNSAYNRDSLLSAADEWLRRMPDFRERQVLDEIREKARVRAPGVNVSPVSTARRPGPIRIVWAARWEHDKDPETFFEALDLLDQQNMPFEVSVLGESFRRIPEVFGSAKQRLGSRIQNWGYLESREAYLTVLHDSDVFVSTARHEFFGLSVVESILAGAFPLLPRRLVYPELLSLVDQPEVDIHYYNGDAASLAQRLGELVDVLTDQPAGLASAQGLFDRMSRYQWRHQGRRLDEGLYDVIAARGGSQT